MSEPTAEKLDAVREWVETGIAKTLEEDPSGFLLGVESASILEALDEIEAAMQVVPSRENIPPRSEVYEKIDRWRENCGSVSGECPCQTFCEEAPIALFVGEARALLQAALPGEAPSPARERA
jgi:hypothetical protein